MYLEGGLFVRVSETLRTVSDSMDDTAYGGWIPAEDPGDGRLKLIRGDRVLWIEQEAVSS